MKRSASTNSEVELGDLVKDRVTGFEGIAFGITDWLYGCKRVTVQPRGLQSAKGDEHGKPLKADTFDIDGVEIIKKGAVSTQRREPVQSTGGPRADAPRTSHEITRSR